MNRNFKIVLRKHTGEFTVVSENAKGSKKSTVCSHSSNLVKLISNLGLGLASFALSPLALAIEDIVLDQEYKSGQWILDNGKVIDIDDLDSANYFNKMKLLGENEGTNVARTSLDDKFNIDLKQNTKFIPETDGPTAAYPVEYLNISDLVALGAITVAQNVNGTLTPLTELPTWQEWDLTVSNAKTNITVELSDGTTRTVDVYNIDNINLTKGMASLNFEAERLVAQPTEPFYQLTLAKINKGELELNGEKIDWKPGQVKESSLFIAEDGATINQNTAIKVTFDVTGALSDLTSESPKQLSFGPKKQLLMDTVKFEGIDYLINSVESLREYNDALIEAVKASTLASAQYETQFAKAFKNVSGNLYTMTYDPSKGYEPGSETDFYLSPAMQAAVGKRAIFESSNNAIVNLNNSVEAIGQKWNRAYNVWAHDSGIINNNSTTTVSSSNTQNALIESGGTFNNEGKLIFNVPSTNWADQVTGNGSTYNNNGIIEITSSTSNYVPGTLEPNEYRKVGRNIAVEVLNGAHAENMTDGQFFIGSSGKSGTATGVHINKNGSFANDGKMIIGINSSGVNQNVTGGNNAETLHVDQANAAVSAYIDASGSNIDIQNSGEITINNTAANTAAINVGFKDPSRPKIDGLDINIVNDGTINVLGKNSTGLKAAGFTSNNPEGVKNSGTINVSGQSSTGIFAAYGAEIVNDGIVNVDDENLTDTTRAYGIRADNATIVLKDNSLINLTGKNVVGLYARTGGTIDVQGGTINVPIDPNSSGQVVYWISGKNTDGVSSTINFSEPVNFELENQKSTLFRIDNGAAYNSDAANSHIMTIKGKNSTGYYLTDNGTEFNSGLSEINVTGDSATGIRVNGGAGLNNKVILSAETKINVTGDNATVAVVDGNKYNLTDTNVTSTPGAKLTSKAKLVDGDIGNVSEGALGYYLINKGQLDHQGEINFTNTTDTTGVKINGGTLNNAGIIKVDGVGVDVYGSNSIVTNTGNVTAVDGIAAIRLNEGASLTLSGNGSESIKGNEKADGVRVHAGATLTTNSAHIEVDGYGSGIHFLNTSSNNAPFTLTGSGTIDVRGNNAAGITLEGQDASGNPTMGNSSLDTTDSRLLIINVYDAGGNGIVTNTSGSVHSGTSVNILSNVGQSAFVVKGNTQDIKQTGNLTSASTTSAVVDLTQSKKQSLGFENSGNILSNGNTAAVDASNLNGVIAFTNAGTGVITGDVVLGGGDNIITNKNNSQLNGKISAGNGDNNTQLLNNSYTEEISLGNGNNTISNSNNAVLDTLTAGDGNNTLIADNTSKVLIAELGNGDNTITNQGRATIGELIAGDGKNKVVLKDASQSSSISLGNGGNTVDIYGGTNNGEIVSGSGTDTFTIHNVQTSQSEQIFDEINAGDGTDQLIVTDNSHYILNDTNKIQNFEGLNITGNSIFEVDNIELNLNQTAGKDGVINIDAGSTYFINFDNTSSDYVLDRPVSGSGVIKTHTNNQAFNFSQDSANFSRDNFEGTLALGNGTLNLRDQNTTALTNATLQLDQNGIATIQAESGSQSILGLTFNKGTLNFEEEFIGSSQDILTSHLVVEKLDVAGEGQINIIADGFDNDYDSQGNLEEVNKLTLLEQDDGINLVGLIKADEVVGNASNIDLKIKDGAGNILTPPDSVEDIRQAGETVAKGQYGVGLSIYDSAGNANGLYAAYQLKEIAIVDQKTLNLESNPGDTGGGLELKAKLTDEGTGSGNIIINSNTDYVALGNSNNDYTGSTTVNKGTLKLNVDTVLGQANQHTSELILNAGTTVDFDATEQFIGTLTSNQSSTVALDDGTLNVDNGGTVNGQITSSNQAKLNILDGELTINGAQNNYQGTTTIENPAAVNINHANGLGSGDVNIKGELNVNNVIGEFDNNLLGDGDMNVNDQSELFITGDNTEFTGNFNIDEPSKVTVSQAQHLGQGIVNNEGELVVTGNDDWTVNNIVQGSGNLTKTGANTIELTNNSGLYTGITTIQSGHIVAGNEDVPVNLNTSLIDIYKDTSFSGFGSTAGDVNNKGTFIVGQFDKDNSTTISTYRVNGDFTNSGDIKLGGESGTGSALSIGGNYVANGGRLYLNTVLNDGGENTQTDQLQVDGDVLRGTGATTIFVKHVGGEGAYTQPDAIKVVDVGGESANNAFKLSSPVLIGIYEYTLGQGRDDDSWYLSSSTESGKNSNPILGAYLSNQNALGMFNMTLHDRLGEPQYAEALKNDDTSASTWVRTVIQNEKYGLMDNHLAIDGDRQIVQLGADIFGWDDNDKYRARFGLMAGFGQQEYDVVSKTTGTRAQAKIGSAYSAGVYGTLYRDTDTPLATYIDAWALYNWYNDNEVTMTDYEPVKYDSRGYNLSLEAGHNFIKKDKNNPNKQWHFQPQVQLTYGSLETDTSLHDSGLRVVAQDSDFWESRVGGRVTYLKDITAAHEVKPFAEFNWHHQFDQSSMVFNGYNFINDYPEDRFQFKLGVEGNTTKNFNGWANVSYTFGDNDYERVEAMAGIKYQW